MRIFLFLLLALNVVSSRAEPVADCDCLPRRAAIDDAPAASALGSEQRPLRDYALFSYRNIANDVVLGKGPYLQTLRELFAPACASPQHFNDWLRQTLLDASGTTDFARRIATAHVLAGRCAGQR